MNQYKITLHLELSVIASGDDLDCVRDALHDSVPEAIQLSGLTFQVEDYRLSQLSEKIESS